MLKQVAHTGGPGSIPGLVKWDLWWTKWRWGRFSPSTSVSPANLHSTKFYIIIITRGTYNRPFSGRRPEWTQLGLHPPTMGIKKKVAHTVSTVLQRINEHKEEVTSTKQWNKNIKYYLKLKKK
jgi:hypothetical protein